MQQVLKKQVASVFSPMNIDKPMFVDPFLHYFVAQLLLSTENNGDLYNFFYSLCRSTFRRWHPTSTEER